MKRGFTKDEVVGRLKAIQGTRTQREFATALGVTQQNLCDVYQGNRNPGKKILDFLGLEPGYVKPENAA